MSRYLIVGAGRSGINAAQLLIKVGEDFIIYDGNENFDTAAACEKIGRDNIEFILGDFSGFDFSRVDICVVSPGVSLETPIMKAVKEHDIPIWGEVELAYRHDNGTVIGITGTNGKTTSTYLLKHVLEKTLGAKVGLIGTIQNMIGDEILHTERTTPESFELQKLFAEMKAAGCTHVIMEVSSHALVLHRADQIAFRVGVFTNLTEDHLDFHKTMDAYCDAKAMLFTRCRTGVVNVDDAYAGRILAQASCRCLTYSAQQPASLRAKHLQLLSDRVEFDAEYDGQTQPVTLGIPGIFSVYNALGVIGAALALEIPLPAIADALRTAQSVKGRVEVVPTPGKDYTVLIDYSHTPDSLENILKAVRGFCRGRVIAVFGCGGDRDPFKRPVMGRIAAQLADLSIVTSDNPRTEDPYKILRQILAGMQEAETPYEVIETREAAIFRAMDLARKDDIIVLCGKGHETYQEIGHEKRHLDEREVVRAYLERER